MFGIRLKQLRNENNMTQKDLANLLKVSPSTIGMYEQGRRDPDTELIKYLANYFKVSTDFLLGNDMSPKNPEDELKINEKDEKDIAKDISKIMNKVTSKEDGPTYYNDVELDEEDMELFKDALEFALKRIKVKNKEKYTPNKYKK